MSYPRRALPIGPPRGHIDSPARTLLRPAGVCLVWGTLTASLFAQPPLAPPNFVFILADDLGWTDLTSYGSDFYETPNIDSLATAGMKFTAAYSASPVCSPTRAAILTGQSPARLNLTRQVPSYATNRSHSSRADDRHTA